MSTDLLNNLEISRASQSNHQLTQHASSKTCSCFPVEATPDPIQILKKDKNVLILVSLTNN